MILADKIITLRKKSGWSQEELAEKMNVTRQSVSKWEGAQSVPDLGKILQLSKLFGVSTDYLLKDELEIEELPQVVEEVTEYRRVSMEEAKDFLHVKQVSSKRIAAATSVCILSPVALILLGALSEQPGIRITENMAGGFGLVILFIMVAGAVAVFISSGSMTNEFQFLDTEIFETEYGVQGMVKEMQKRYKDTYTRKNVIGTCLCILSVIPLFGGMIISEEDLFLCIMLSVMLGIVAVGVYFFVEAGIRWESMEKLLQQGDYSRQNKKKNKIMGPIAAAFWLIVAAGYLWYSFTTNLWWKSWVIWPVAALVFGAVASIGSAIQKKK